MTVPEAEQAQDDFLVFLRELRYGTFLVDAAEALAEVVDAVRETGRDGSVVLKFTVKPATKGGGPSLVVRDVIVAKAPKPETADTLMFALAGGRLSRRDPRQPQLPFAESKQEGVD